MNDAERLSLKLAAVDLTWKGKVMTDPAVLNTPVFREWAQDIHDRMMAFNLEVERRSRE